MSDIEQSIKSKIESIGTPLNDWDIQINYGIKTGYNDAFVITTEKRNEILANCADDAERERTTELIRPILRGRDIKRYGYDWNGLWLINTHNGVKEKYPPVNIEEYPSIKRHLDLYWDKISSREDQGVTPYNLRNCAYMDDFNKPKIVYAELARTGNAFTIDTQRMVIGNTSYMIAFDDVVDESRLYCLTGFLNSKVTLFYLDISCSKFDENGWRWLRQYVENIPIPQYTSEILQKEVANLLIETTKEGLAHINTIVYDIFGLTQEEIDYLERRYANY